MGPEAPTALLEKPRSDDRGFFVVLVANLYHMGKLNIQLLLEGTAIYEPGFGSDHPLFYRPEAREAYSLFHKYPIGQLRKIETDGDDYTLSFDVTHKIDSIDWGSLSYPSDTIRDKVLDVLYREEVRNKLMKIRDRWGEATSAYSLDRITDEAIKIIKDIRPKPEQEFYESYKDDVIGSLLYTSNKEVEVAKSAKRKNQADHLASAIRRLRLDLDGFLSLL
jgi:hypothetical protein